MAGVNESYQIRKIARQIQGIAELLYEEELKLEYSPRDGMMSSDGHIIYLRKFFFFRKPVAILWSGPIKKPECYVFSDQLSLALISEMPEIEVIKLP